MFLKSYQLLFISTLMLGTMMAVSSNSWFTAWLGLEINLMSMIPLMLMKLSSSQTDACIKYFLTQAMASILLIFPASFNLLSQESINLEVLELLMTISLVMKAGLAPLHFWFPQIILNLSWVQSILILTWQKIAPLILLTSLNMTTIIYVAAISAMTGALGGFNQISIKLILTYSSIAHSAWMIMACFINFKAWLFYFSVYCFLSLAIILFFIKNKMLNFNEIIFSSDSSFNKYILSLNMLSLAGLPPLLGFSVKLSIIFSLIFTLVILILAPLIFSSLVSVFYYCRLIYSNLLNSSNKNIYKHNTNLLYPKTFMVAVIFFNFMAPLYFIM